MPAAQPKRILSIGESMVELSPAGDGHYALGFAGDTLNTAWYLRRELQDAAQVEYFTCIGTDDISSRMLAFLDAAGLGTRHIRRLPDRTVGLYLIELTNGERSFAYWRSTSAARMLASDPGALDQALAGTDLAYLSGITLAILPEADRRTLLSALAAARARGTEIVFDPNLRPRLWPDRDTMCRAVTEAAAGADLVLPSFDDEAAAFGDAAPLETARRYLAAGARLAVVKNAGGPMVVQAAGGDSLTFTPPEVTNVVDTTAAGDSFNAGFLAARLRGADLPEALARGAALAGQVIGHRGALLP